jgi:hypothetical protein
LILVVDCFQRRKGEAAVGDTAAVCFGRAPVRRFSVRNLRGKSQGGAPGGEEEDRREKEALGSPSTTNSSEMPADVQTSDEEIRRSRCISSERMKRRGEKRSGVLIGI